MLHALSCQLCRLLTSLPLVHTTSETLLFRECLEKLRIYKLNGSFTLDITLDLLICLSVFLRNGNCYRIILAYYRRIRGILFLQFSCNFPCGINRLNTGVSLLFGKRSIVFGIDSLIPAFLTLTGVLLCSFGMCDLSDRSIHHIIQHRNVLLGNGNADLILALSSSGELYSCRH